MNHDLFIKAIEASKIGQKYAFATVIEATLKGTPRKSGAKMLVLEDGAAYGTIGGGRYEKQAQKECRKAINTGKSSIVTYKYFGEKGQSICGGLIKVYIEPVTPIPHFVICGAGHIALPLSLIAKTLNFKVTIIDDRKNLANKKRFPHADQILLGDHAKKLAKTPITDETYVMIVTQGNEYDFACLKTIVKKDAAYIGVISSKLKKQKFFKRLKEEFQVEQKYLKRVHIPAGIDIGAQTPEEIAVSIASEIIRVRNKKFMGTAKFKIK